MEVVVPDCQDADPLMAKKAKRLFFVLSCGRSGSKTAAETFDQFPDCVCPHEPDPVLIQEAADWFCKQQGHRELVETLRRTRPGAIRQSVYGEANQQLSLIIPVLDEVYPNCRFIWLIRDGRDAVASMYARGWYDSTVSKVPQIWHDARLQGNQTGDFSAVEWANMDRFQRCCWLWKKYNLAIESGLARLDDNRSMSIRLDHIKESLPVVVTFLGLTKHSAVIERRNRAIQPVTQWEGWTVGQRAQFESLCAEVMDRWFPEWRGPDGAWSRIETEPPDSPGVLMRVRRNLSSRVGGLARLRRRLAGLFNLGSASRGD